MKTLKDKKARIQPFIHCNKCLNVKLGFWYTKEGIQAICEECNTVVYDLDLEKEKANTKGDN